MATCVLAASLVLTQARAVPAHCLLQPSDAAARPGCRAAPRQQRQAHLVGLSDGEKVGGRLASEGCGAGLLAGLDLVPAGEELDVVDKAELLPETCTDFVELLAEVLAADLVLREPLVRLGALLESLDPTLLKLLAQPLHRLELLLRAELLLDLSDQGVIATKFTALFLLELLGVREKLLFVDKVDVVAQPLEARERR